MPQQLQCGFLAQELTLLEEIGIVEIKLLPVRSGTVKRVSPVGWSCRRDRLRLFDLLDRGRLSKVCGDPRSSAARRRRDAQLLRPIRVGRSCPGERGEEEGAAHLCRRRRGRM